MSSNKLTQWAAKGKSSVLVVNGEKHSKMKDDISSAAAFVSARIASSLESHYSRDACFITIFLLRQAPKQQWSYS